MGKQTVAPNTGELNKQQLRKMSAPIQTEFMDFSEYGNMTGVGNMTYGELPIITTQPRWWTYQGSRFPSRASLKEETTMQALEMDFKRKQPSSPNASQSALGEAQSEPKWRRLSHSPTRHNDHPQLELPRAWESSDSLWPPPNGERKASQFSVFYGNTKHEDSLRKKKEKRWVLMASL
jgi:hypothetical protein